MSDLPPAGPWISTLPPTGLWMSTLPPAGPWISTLPPTGPWISTLPPAGLWMSTLPPTGKLLPSDEASDSCNKTIRGQRRQKATEEGRLTLRMPSVKPEDKGKPLYCWFRFEGTDQQFIHVDVRDIRAGNYDHNTKDCQRGYLRISDTESCSTDPTWLPPTTLCGHYEQGQLRVKRITRSQSAFVEFKLEKARPSKGYEFDVTFVDKETEDENPPFGHLQRTDGRIDSTKCDWLIPVDQCFGYCRVVSPGFPGIYPPNTRCRYLFTNFDDSRVDLKLGGSGFRGKFDMKKSDNCTDDFVEVYDGMSTINPLIGRYCGHDAEHIISTGSSVLLLFQSGPGGPPWDYSGFDIQVTDRWKNNHEGGDRVAGSVCDWLFKSSDSDEGSGDVHSPDHMLDEGATCWYNFSGEFNQRVELQLVVYPLRPNCTERLDVYDGDILLDTICKNRLKRPRQEFKFNTTGPLAVVKYTNEDGQRSNPQPVWIYYTFWTDRRVLLPPPTTSSDTARNVFIIDVNGSGVEGASAGGQGTGRTRTGKTDREPAAQPKMAETRGNQSSSVSPSLARPGGLTTPPCATAFFVCAYLFGSLGLH